MRTARLALAAGLALAAVPMLALAPRIAREGDAAHRETMSAMEAKPFDTTLLAGLSAWVGGDAVAAEAVGGGGVMAVALIDVSQPASMTALNTLTRLQRTEGEKGLTVFAVHPADRWDDLKALADQNRIRVPVALDADGSFAKGLHADDAPDLYVIDRAGQLRYADIDTRALPLAINALLRETKESAIANAAEEAAERSQRMAEAAERAEKEAAKPAPKADGPRKQATPEQYRAAAWPAHNSGELYASNVQGSRLPVALGSEQWISGQQDLAGKVVILDFWATWCGPCIRAMPMLDQLQKRYSGSMAVLGVAGQGEDLNKVRTWLSNNGHSYGQLFDANQRVYRSLGVRAIPHVVVMSTDGVVRWQGNPLSSGFRDAVDQIMRVDPGL